MRVTDDVHLRLLEETDLAELYALVENRRSRAIPERLGFRQDGTLRRAELVGDRFLDVVVCSMLAEEWPTPE